MSNAAGIQGVLIRHVLSGGSQHANHFGIEAYERDPSIDSSGVPRVLHSLQKFSGACHGGYDRRLAMEMRNEIKRSNRHLSEDGLDAQLDLALEKLGHLVEGNLSDLEAHIYKQEGKRYSNLY